MSAGSIAAATTFVETYTEPPRGKDGPLKSEDAEKWAARIPAPTYAIDDDTAVSVVDGTARAVSEGQWRLFRP